MENVVLNQNDFICLSDMSDDELEAWFNAPVIPEEYVVVHHPCYRSDTDLGLRIYKADDQYLEDNTSMYSIEGRFNSAEDAVAYIGQEVINFYKNNYDA